MNLPGLDIDWTRQGPARIRSGAPLPVETMLRGRPLTEVAELLPRLFNLCGAAQGAAFRLAVGLPQAGDPGAEIIRDHMTRLMVIWPRLLGLPAQPGDFALPAPAALAGWLQSDAPFARLMAAIKARLPGEIRLPDASDDLIAAGVACENTPAGRRADHPLMRAAEADHGRGLFWRALGRLVDLVETKAGHLPEPRLIGPGAALAPAARGAYLLRAAHSDGRLTALSRITPTDALIAPGGLLARALSDLTDRDHAELALSILDPCLPVNLHEAPHA
ncbi:MAG: HupK protein [Paracoccus sp. (in: a-proteobacteria)]|nr:HupK protein [Paracoccus sp. (in: a-proteobacteria)]